MNQNVAAEGSRKSGVELIAEERQRQISVEGWTPEHDDDHWHGELPQAASIYAQLAAKQAIDADAAIAYPDGWPWSYYWWKPSTDPIRNLVKAGALIAADIDRLQRAAAPSRDLSREPDCPYADAENRLRDAVIAAARQYCQKTQEDMDSLEGSISMDIPVEFMELHAAVRELDGTGADQEPEEDEVTEDGDLCESCDAPATKYDVEMVPLCDACWDDLARETAEIQSSDLSRLPDSDTQGGTK